MNFFEAYAEMKKGKIIQRGAKRRHLWSRQLRIAKNGDSIEMRDFFGWAPAYYLPKDLDATDWEVVE